MSTGAANSTRCRCSVVRALLRACICFCYSHPSFRGCVCKFMFCNAIPFYIATAPQEGKYQRIPSEYHPNTTQNEV